MSNLDTPLISKYPKLGSRLAVGFAVFATLSVLAVTTVIYFSFRNQIRQDTKQRLLNMVAIAALQQDGDLHDALKNPEDENSPAYQKIKATNAAIVATDPDIAYVYTMRQDEQGNIVFLVDTGPEGVPTQPLLDLYPDAGKKLVNNFATMQQPIVEDDFYTDEDGTFLSAYAPFYRANGTRAGVVGMDIRANAVLAKERQFFSVLLLAVFIGLPIISGIGWVIGNQLSKPIAMLAKQAEKLARGDLSIVPGHKTRIQEVFELEQALSTMATRLRELISGLEQRVAERTSELEKSSQELADAKQQVEARVEQLRAIAAISRNIATIQNPDVLLPEITRLISDLLGYYHVGIFLNDENNQFTILRAANSEGGQRMLARQHKLAIGQTGLVGYVAQSGKARIALDTDTDTIFFENPDLPETRSEIALPLRFGNRIIGVLDVQSDLPNAFAESDIETLSILADQTATAIQTTRLLEETRKALQRSEQIYTQYVQQSWRTQLDYQPIKGFQFDSQGIRPLEKTQTAMRGQQKSQASNLVSVPIKVHDIVIGYLNIQPENNQGLDPDEQDIIAATAERVALAIENARLIADSQRRAAKEQTIGEISAKLGASINIDNVLRTALLELGQIIPGSEIFVEFERDAHE